MRRVLVTGGAPRVAIDAVRFLRARSGGGTAIRLVDRLRGLEVAADLCLSDDVPDRSAALRYADRAGLDAQVRTWVRQHPHGVVVMAAAVNDWQLDRVDVVIDGAERPVRGDEKASSRADGLVVRLAPAPKLIDALRGWGLLGPIVGFKYEAAATVLAAAAALRERTGAALVVANSLCGSVQALVDAQGAMPCADRKALEDQLAQRVAALAV
jgi:hypothetical protein